jgi:hypothetical protein
VVLSSTRPWHSWAPPWPGAFLVLAVGVARTTQLRLANRRGKKLQKQTEAQLNRSEG